MLELRIAKEKEYLNVTIKALNNPALIIDIVKEDGINGLLKYIIAPSADLLIKSSFLNSSNKAKLTNKVNRMVNTIDKNAKNTKLGPQKAATSSFKLVA